MGVKEKDLTAGKEQIKIKSLFIVVFKLLSKLEEQQKCITPLERKPIKFMNVI